MIEIIKRGTRKTCTCSECGCCFSYEEDDVEIVYTTSNVFGVNTKLAKNAVKCPQCDTEIVVKLTK